MEDRCRHPVSVQDSAVDMLLAVQADLLSAARGDPATGPFAFGLAPEAFLAVANKLARLAMASIAWERRAEFLLDWDGLPEASDDWTPGTLSIRGAVWIMAIIGALLSQAAGQPRFDVIWKGRAPLSADRAVRWAGLLEWPTRATEAELRELLQQLGADERGLHAGIQPDPHAEWARRILAEPVHASELHRLRGGAKGKALGRVAREQILRLEAELPNHYRRESHALQSRNRVPGLEGSSGMTACEITVASAGSVK